MAYPGSTTSSFELRPGSTDIFSTSAYCPPLYDKERRWRQLDAPWWRDEQPAQPDKPESAGSSSPPSSGVTPTPDIENKWPETLKIATRLGRQDANQQFAPLRDARGVPWNIIRHHLETTFDVRLPPNSKVAWVAAQAAMGLKGLRFSDKFPDKEDTQGKQLATQDAPAPALTLGRVDCGMARSFKSAKEARFPINYQYRPDSTWPQDITSLFRLLLVRSAAPLTPNMNPEELVHWCEWQPIFWPSGVANFIDLGKLGQLFDACRDMLERENQGVILMLPLLQFLSEILWRCCYIFEGFRGMAPVAGLELNLLGEPVEDLMDFARKGRCYWPWLGPNIALDVFLFEQGILREIEPFNPQNNYLVRLYGIGLRDLRFLQRNPNEREREEQLDTLHRCHLLRSWLGRDQAADLTEQLEFCCFSMAASMKHPFFHRPQRNWQPGMKTHEERAKARQREFKILKIMVDRVWHETQLHEGRRRAPLLLRRAFNASTGQMREGDWALLEMEQQRLLLGGRSPFHTEHPDHKRLRAQWLPDLVGLDANFCVKSNPDFYSGLALTPVAPPRGSYGEICPGMSPAPTTWMLVEEFINKYKGCLNTFAPEGLEEFIEIHDASVLEKKVSFSAAYPIANLFAPRPPTFLHQGHQRLLTKP
ncbi:hypothetical protein PG984_000403 [Apiospora sp. TS-2023a]